MSGPSHPIIARLYDPVMAVAERTTFPPHREFLAAGLSGRVLDLGAGTGAMFPYFADGAVDLHAVEPDPYMRTRARERGRELGVDVDIIDASATSLPYADDSFDAVVASLVFCTIPDPDAALSEVARVLEPGGEFRFLEHVRGDGTAGYAHDLLAPAWHAAAGGCNLNRETGRRFCSDDRFRVARYERVSGGLLPIVRGRLARKPDSGPVQNLLARLLPAPNRAEN